MAENDDLIAFIQRAVGMSLMGVIRDHVLSVAYGTGQNGKSTLFNALLDTFGPDYGMKAPLGLLMAKSNEQHPCERADLFGKRFVVCIEVEEGQRFAESLVKELTGGDRIRARFMRQDFFEFSPTHHLFLCVNHKPTVRGTDTGIWRRIRLWPFSIGIPEEEQDKQLPEKLQAERAGILAWAVCGAIAWANNGLAEPDEVRMATAAYRSEQDVLATFIVERCEVNSYFNVRASALYSEYAKWADNAGEYVLPQRRFGLALAERGFERYTSNGTWYRGIGLTDPHE
jgi:putative DNA primase/helicase